MGLLILMIAIAVIFCLRVIVMDLVNNDVEAGIEMIVKNQILLFGIIKYLLHEEEERLYSATSIRIRMLPTMVCIDMISHL